MGQNFRKAEYKAVVKKLKHRLRAIKAESGDGIETNPTIEKIIKLTIVRDIFLLCCYTGYLMPTSRIYRIPIFSMALMGEGG